MGKVKFLDLSCAATKQQITRCTCLLKRKNICAKIKCQFTWTEKSIFRFRKSNTKYLKYLFRVYRQQNWRPIVVYLALLARISRAFHDLVASMIFHATRTRSITCSITYSTTCSISGARLTSRNSPVLRNETKGSRGRLTFK